MDKPERLNRDNEHDRRVRRNERFRMYLMDRIPGLGTTWSGRGDAFVIRFAGTQFVVREVDNESTN